MLLRLLRAALLSILCLIVILPIKAGAEDFVFETDFINYTISANGMNKSLKQKQNGNELLAVTPSPFVSVKKDGTFYPASSIKKVGELLRVDFGQAGITATYRITKTLQYIIIELTGLEGNGIQEIQFAVLPIQKLERSGSWIVARSSEKFTVSMMSLSDSVNTRLEGSSLVSSVYPAFGMLGRKAAIIAVPTSQFLDVVRKIEIDFKLPYFTLNGKWAKQSADVKKSYLFTDLTEKNVDETIAYAKRGNFNYILVYNFTWSGSMGSYPINKTNYPNGENGLKATIDKCHAAGIKVGLHMLTSLVDRNDSIVQPIPSPHLLKQAEMELAEDIDAKAESILIKEDLINFKKSSGINDFQINNEIVRCNQVEQNKLLNCVRGRSGQKASIHNKGSKVYKLFKTGESYFVDLKSPLKNILSERIAGIINRSGFDMIYFDGGELNRVNDPYWYWGAQQQIDILKRIKRDVLVQGSGWTPWGWHIFTRAACDDYGAVFPKHFLDYHKIKNLWQLYKNNFMPADLGWWGILADAPDHPATTPDEVELLGIRSLALDTPISIETNMKDLKANGRTDEMLNILGEYERMRTNGTVPPALRENLSNGEWHLVSDGNKKVFYPVNYNSKRVEMPASIAVSNEYDPQPLKFRLQVATAVSKAGDKSNVVLVDAKRSLLLKNTISNDSMPGALAGRIDFTDQPSPFFARPDKRADKERKGVGLNLLNNRAIFVKLRVDGQLPKSERPADVINIQLESGGKMYRDYYIDLDFTGEKTIIIPEPTTVRLLPEFQAANYSFKRAMYGFNYGNVNAINFRWMRRASSSQIKCWINQVEALKENDTVVKNLFVKVGDKKISIPVKMHTGDYAEFWGGGNIRVFDKNGMLRFDLPTSAQLPYLVRGDNSVLLGADNAASFKMTFITFGAPIIL